VAGTSKGPGPEETFELSGVLRQTQTQEDRVGCGSEPISARGYAVGSRSAFIVPLRAGNRARRDPKEEREAPRGETHWRETRKGTMNPHSVYTKRQWIAALARRPGAHLDQRVTRGGIDGFSVAGNIHRYADVSEALP